MKLQAAIRVAERVVSEGSEVPSVVGALKALHAEVERLRKLLKELRNATCDLCACVGVAPAGVLRDANKAMDAALEAITIPEGG